MKIRFLCLPLVLLAGCDASPPVDYIAQDSARCAAAGFAPGSDAMAQCMRTAANERQSEANREAVQQELQAQRDAEEEARRQAQNAADDKAFDERFQQFLNNGSGGTGTGSADPGPDPTASRIPGMECTGVGASASCDALSSY